MSILQFGIVTVVQPSFGWPDSTFSNSFSHFDEKFFMHLKGRIIEIEQAAARKTDCC